MKSVDTMISYADMCRPRLDDEHVIPRPPRTEDLNTIPAATPAPAHGMILPTSHYYIYGYPPPPPQHAHTHQKKA